VQGREVDVFAGIDVSKDRLDICIRPSGETFAVTRDDQGLERLVERFARFRRERAHSMPDCRHRP
jgi:transposase